MFDNSLVHHYSSSKRKRAFILPIIATRERLAEGRELFTLAFSSAPAFFVSTAGRPTRASIALLAAT